MVLMLGRRRRPQAAAPPRQLFGYLDMAVAAADGGVETCRDRIAAHAARHHYNLVTLLVENRRTHHRRSREVLPQLVVGMRLSGGGQLIVPSLEHLPRNYDGAPVVVADQGQADSEG